MANINGAHSPRLKALDECYRQYLTLFRDAEEHGLHHTMAEIRLILADLRENLRDASRRSPSRTTKFDESSSSAGDLSQTMKEDFDENVSVDELNDACTDTDADEWKDPSKSHKRSIAEKYMNLAGSVQRQDPERPSSQRQSPNTSPLAEESFTTTAKLSRLKSVLKSCPRPLSRMERLPTINLTYEAQPNGTRLTRSLPLPGNKHDTNVAAKEVAVFKGDKLSIQNRFTNAMSAPDVVENPFDLMELSAGQRVRRKS